MRRIAKASPGGGTGTVVGVVGEAVGLDVLGAVGVGWANWRSRVSTVAACARLVVKPTTPSSQTTKRSSRTPAVMASSPTVPTTPRTTLTRLSAAGDAVEVDGAGVGREVRLVGGRDVVGETDRVDPLAVDPHLRVAVERGLEGGGVADRLDDVGRRVDPALEEQGVADALDGGGGDDALVLDHHRLGAAGPKRVDDALDVLLVDDDVVRSVGLGQAGGAAVGVVQRDGDDGATDGLGPHERGEDGGLLLEALDLSVPGGGLGGELVHLGLEGADLFGLGGDVAVLVGDETREVTAGAAQLGAVRGGVAGREEGAGQQGDEGDDESPGGGPCAA